MYSEYQMQKPDINHISNQRKVRYEIEIDELYKAFNIRNR